MSVAEACVTVCVWVPGNAHVAGAYVCMCVPVCTCVCVRAWQNSGGVRKAFWEILYSNTLCLSFPSSSYLNLFHLLLKSAAFFFYTLTIHCVHVSYLLLKNEPTLYSNSQLPDFLLPSFPYVHLFFLFLWFFPPFFHRFYMTKFWVVSLLLFFVPFIILAAGSLCWELWHYQQKAISLCLCLFCLTL